MAMNSVPLISEAPAVVGTVHLMLPQFPSESQSMREMSMNSVWTLVLFSF